MNKKELIIALENAIKDYKGETPGAWSVQSEMDNVQLVWRCAYTELEATKTTQYITSECPMRVWGGDAILSLAKVTRKSRDSWDIYSDGHGGKTACYQAGWYFPYGDAP